MNEKMLTNEYINSFLSKRNEKIKNTNETKKNMKQQKNTKHNNPDKLFWYIYNIIYPNNIIKNTFIEEKQKKFKWMEMINDNKKLCKKYKNIQPFLISHKNINIETADAVCHIFNLSVILIIENTYIHLNKPEINPIAVKYVYNYNLISDNETYDYISNNYYYVENYKKLLFSISHYKLLELKDIAIKLGIDIPVKHKKKDIYDDIEKRLNLIYSKID
jgi:hypothetical protein